MLQRTLQILHLALLQLVTNLCLLIERLRLEQLLHKELKQLQALELES